MLNRYCWLKFTWKFAASFWSGLLFLSILLPKWEQYQQRSTKKTVSRLTFYSFSVFFKCTDTQCGLIISSYAPWINIFPKDIWISMLCRKLTMDTKKQIIRRKKLISFINMGMNMNFQEKVLGSFAYGQWPPQMIDCILQWFNTNFCFFSSVLQSFLIVEIPVNKQTKTKTNETKCVENFNSNSTNLYLVSLNWFYHLICFSWNCAASLRRHHNFG